MQDNANTGLLTTISRRASLRQRAQPDPRPPSYPAAGGHSFDLNELGGDSDEEEAGLTVAPPPQYGDVVMPSGYVPETSLCVCVCTHMCYVMLQGH